MAGFLARLFGGGKAEDDARGKRNEDKAVEHAGFRIVPAPMRQAGGWLVAGFITKEVGGVVKEHHFIRADTLASLDEAEDHAILKARRTIDEQGEAIFKEG